jgi:NAD(P)H dehydrogenase (quinone)
MIIYVVFYSEHGLVYKLAEAVAEGAQSVDGALVEIFRTAELTRSTNQDKPAATDSRKSFAHVPIISAKELSGADAIIFGTPANFGMMAAQMRNLLDQTRPLWADGALVGKVGSVFTSTSIPHGGQESTLTSFHTTLLHLGMIIVGVPYCENRLLPIDAISGRNPYGASAIVGPDGDFVPNETEIGIARFQGQHVAEVTNFLIRGKERSGG